MPSKNQIIDKLNEMFEELENKTASREYSRVIRDIQKDVIEEYDKNGELKGTTIRKIINKHKLDVNKFDKNTLNAYILSGITAVIENGKKDNNLRNMVFVLNIYSITRPKELANAINKVSNQILHNNQKLTPREQRLFNVMDDYYKKNIKEIGKLARQQQQMYRDIHKTVTTNLSREIMRDLKRWKRDKDGKPLTFEQVNEKLRDKYSESKNRVERIINTETHSQNEQVKFFDMKARGYRQKIWVNQRDNRVRTSHKGSPLTTKWIGINDKFNLTGTSETAMFPGDNSLSAGERINCRCFAKYRK